MQKFNQVIKVEINVDSIAKQLLSTHADSFPHAELLTEMIIGTALETGTIGKIYNALNGYDVLIDFKEGDKMECSETYYGYIRAEGEKTKRDYMPIGVCTVTAVNKYSLDKQVCVEFDRSVEEGTKKDTLWVNMNKLKAIVGDIAA
jgi:hypothetical protein